MSVLCPECSAPLDADERFVAWCASCDWNLLPPPAPPRRLILPRLQERLVRNLHEGGIDRFSLARMASYALALLVHLLTLAILITGVWLVVAFTFVSVPVGVVLIGLAWLMRPRFGRLPDDAEVLTRQDAPRLYQLVDEIGARAGAPRTDVVVLSGDINASYGTYGLRRRRVLTLGYPLWLVLTPQERIALLGHELAHSSNGDSRHGVVVGTAFGALAELRSAARSDREAVPEHGLFVLVGHWASQVVLWLLRLTVGGFDTVLELVNLRSSQRAEYRADAMSVEIAGTVAAASALDAHDTRCGLAASFLETRTMAIPRNEGLWEALQAYMSGIPESEFERRRRGARLVALRVDRTHPPSYLRHEHVLGLPYREPAVTAAGMGEIDRELAVRAGRVERELRDSIRATLYQ
ncbi:M48 family metallopeptidase [Nonomuraea sediminis]|uniref:M48 family metallopeptidase n=1 Tax=Nonomuraea sediminis TaxID=2835864 RepID=UPI001BDD8095|nr:M48 family metallopeptidase [Nonomuraea sediminis]